MSDRWVVNASPLIALCKISHQALLFELTDDIVERNLGRYHPSAIRRNHSCGSAGVAVASGPWFPFA